MKKFLALLLAITMVSVFAGCSKNQPGNSDSDDSWSKIEKAGVLKLGMDSAFPPMGYIDEETGDITGFDVEVATEVCSRLGIELKLTPINWKAQLNELNNGNVDCLWNGLSVTEERQKNMNLSEAYMRNNQIILVKKDSSYQNLADLAGKRLSVQSGSSAAEALEEATEFKASLGEIVGLDDYSKAIQEIKNGTVDCIAIDEVVARHYLAKEPDMFRILEEDGKVISLAEEDYVIGFRKGEDALKNKIIDTIKEMAKDGKLKEISTKWFAEDVTVIK